MLWNNFTLLLVWRNVSVPTLYVICHVIRNVTFDVVLTIFWRFTIQHTRRDVSSSLARAIRRAWYVDWNRMKMNSWIVAILHTFFSRVCIFLHICHLYLYVYQKSIDTRPRVRCHKNWSKPWKKPKLFSTNNVFYRISWTQMLKIFIKSLMLTHNAAILRWGLRFS